MSEDLKARVRRFLEEVSRDWGVRPPDVVIRPITEVRGARAYYDDMTKTIVLDHSSVDLRTVLHEFAHHLQSEYGMFERIKMLREVLKPHCARNYEEWAKAFELNYDMFYERLWREVVGVR